MVICQLSNWGFLDRVSGDFSTGRNNVVVANKLMKFKVLKIRPKQSDTACAKMVNLAVKDAKEAILAANAQTPFEKCLAMSW